MGRRREPGFQARPWSELSVRHRLSTAPGELALLGALLVVVIGVATVDDFVRLRDIQQHGVPATAVVVDVRDFSKSPDRPIVRVNTADGGSFSAEVGWQRWEGGPVVGDTRPVLYLPADPEGTVVDRTLSYAHTTHVLGLVAMAVIGWGDVVLWRNGTLVPRHRRGLLSRRQGPRA
ncbi:DUF3592 domain-containing protein [Nonomuraea sp. NPDC050556]|uniref:DUF3592 domain-containing protein n=1 Tax=Nonomuraea sp. NPDC050556 TaxID=3364369 RepID=UPI0037BC0EE7